MEVKKDILWRVYLIYFFICLFGVAIIAKICVIQFVEGDALKAKAENLSTRFFDIEAVRGNIYDANGSLLATSLPYFETGIDVNTQAITDEIFSKHVDSLAYCLANLFKDKSQREYKKMLVKARNKKDRWVMLKRDVSYTDLQKMKKFPILRRGKNRGGFVYLQTNKRERPFQFLAARTIGKINENGTGKSYGLEVAFDSILQGKRGHRWMQKIAGNVWRPINDDNEIDPEDGSDIVSTIDINVQDVAENSLMNSLKKHGADHGCLILMEIKTGEVKAIANLKRNYKDTASYLENLNYAVGVATVPGSTFKLPSLIAVMEDFNVSLEEKVDIGNGVCYYSNERVADSHPPEKSILTVQEVFELSSNVGVTKIISRYYAKDPKKFIDRLYKMNLNAPLGIPIPGEAVPYIKNTDDKSWSKISLQWISYGYETRISPLQILNYYSAVANNGKMMRPMFVKEIRKRGKVIKTFEPEVINPAICSEATVKKAKKMMEGVVSHGTAKSLKAADYLIAGKTGTAQMGMVNGKMTYQASFVGYFPADNPKYACIVVVSAPSGDAYYGGAVAGPVFKDVADKVYSSSLEIHKEINDVQPVFASRVPSVKGGTQSDVNYVLKALKIRSTNPELDSEWVGTSSNDSTSITLTGKNTEQALKRGIVPNLLGMTAKDVLYLLENNGMRVKLIGSGSVAKQSIQAGAAFTKGTQIILQLI
ncbi:MAG: penicillin-binding transpeptidase domain-containing protein [Bacteroidota bacterium]|nr:penicillin-binding transpeptidase domain-containing protein [Bacteroidota bacterium]